MSDDAAGKESLDAGTNGLSWPIQVSRGSPFHQFKCEFSISDSFSSVAEQLQIL